MPNELFPVTVGYAAPKTLLIIEKLFMAAATLMHGYVLADRVPF